MGLWPIDEVLVMVDPNAAEDYYYAHNHLYSPTALLDDTGAVLERYDYDAYGRPYFLDPNLALSATQSSAYKNTVLFTGRTVDILDNGSLTLQYNRNRYYDYHTGRWLTKDPIGFRGGVNLYQYVRSNPVIYTDSRGLLQETGGEPNPEYDDIPEWDCRFTNECEDDPHVGGVPIPETPPDDYGEGFLDRPLGSDIVDGAEAVFQAYKEIVALRDKIDNSRETVEKAHELYLAVKAGNSKEGLSNLARWFLERSAEKGFDRVLNALGGTAPVIGIIKHAGQCGSATGQWITGKMHYTLEELACRACGAAIASDEAPSGKKYEVTLAKPSGHVQQWCWYHWRSQKFYAEVVITGYGSGNAFKDLVELFGPPPSKGWYYCGKEGQPIPYY